MVDIRRIDMGAPTFGPYSPGIKANNLIFVSGQVPDKGVRDIKAQTLNTLEKIKKILKAAGANVSNIVKISVYLRNMGDFKEMNDVYKKFFEQNGVSDKFPTRSTIEATCPLSSALVEIDAIAVI